MLFSRYQPVQRERLQSLIQTPEWEEFLARPETLQQFKDETTISPAAPGQLGGAAQYLKDRNVERVKALIHSGVTEQKVLMQALNDWETALAGDDPFPILFLGLVLTLDCSFDPRCLYCNQVWLPRLLGLEEWKNLLVEVAKPIPPYVYLTGGEPLMLGEIWGDDGLVAFATKLGCAVNINTNAAFITPQAALQLVKVGLARLHISLDSADPEVQGKLFQVPERVEEVLRGIYNVQIARELLGVKHPQIHINCVLTRPNLFQFPELLSFLLEINKVPSAEPGGKITSDPAFGDFLFHLIPVGGSENIPLRPTAEEWKRFYTETWAEAEQIWQDYQESIGVPKDDKTTLTGHVPFANPFQRVNHQMTIDEYCDQASRGIYWEGALTEHCHIVPSQAFILPDGSQHWCGAHAVRRPTPLGNVRDATIRENIRRNLKRLAELPNEFCPNCAGATCVINQMIENNLNNQIAEWVKEAAPSTGSGETAT